MRAKQRYSARGGLIVAIALATFPNAFTFAKEGSKDRPNFVLILGDDQSYRDFGFLGNADVHTPNLDRLAAQSARFPNGYVPMSVCRPSLATLLTGLYPHQHGAHFNHPPPGLATMRRMTAKEYRQTRATTDYLLRDTATIPRILAASGYACLQTGKHWEGDFANAGFTHGMTLGRPAATLDAVTGTRQQRNGEPVAHGNGDAGLVIGRRTMRPIRDFLKERREDGQPFFIWYAPFLPHTPFNAEPRFARLYQDRNIPPHLLPYYAEIARFDESVGQLFNLIEQEDLSDTTMVVFVSDNGFRPARDNPQRQDRRSKLSPYEDGLRTPILIRWPGRTKPADHHRLVQTIDLAPTILTAAGLSAKITPQMRGIDLTPVTAGLSPLPERDAFGAIYPNDAATLGQPSRHVRGKWIRHGPWKFILPGPAAKPLSKALYHLPTDPQENKNLADLPEHQSRIADLERRIRTWWPDGDDSRVTRKRSQP